MVRSFFMLQVLLSIMMMACKMKKEYMESVKFKYSWPLPQDDGTILQLQDSLSIFSRGAGYIFRLPYIILDIQQRSVIPETQKFSYFIVRSGDSTGKFFSKSTDIPEEVSLDSLLVSRGLLGNNFIDLKSDSLIQSVVHVQDFARIERYVSRIKKDASYPDTTIVYYTKGKLIPIISLAKSLEKEHGLHVQKIEIIYNSQVYPGYPHSVSSRRMSVSLQKVFEQDSVVARLFQVYR